MRTSTRLVAAGLVSLLAVAPATALAEPTVGGPVTHRQSVLTSLDATGAVRSSSVITQLSTTSVGDVDVALAGQSTSGLRNLDGFGRPRSQDGNLVVQVPAGGVVRTIADSTVDTPVAFTVSYTLDGETVTPKELVGRSGVVEVTYDIRNLTAQPTELTYRDGDGTTKTETVDVAVPFVGSLSTTLDGRFADVEAPGAVVVGDGRGNTVVNWSLLLFSPLGSENVTISYRAIVEDAIVPAARAQVLPVDSSSFGSLAATETAYSNATNDTRQLTLGAVEIDRNVQRLAAGARELLAGLVKLSDGSRQLADGLGDASDGAGQLSAGMTTARTGGDELTSGLGRLAGGSADLAAGMTRARDGGDLLNGGLLALYAGSRDLKAGLAQARQGGADLSAGLGQIDGGAQQLHAGTSQLAGGAAELDAKAGELAVGAGQVSAGATQLLGGLELLAKSVNDPAAGLPAAIAGVAMLRAGVGDAATADTLVNGMHRIGLGLSNAACDPANPTDPANPCGVREVLGLLAAGVGTTSTSGSLANGVALVDGGLDNPLCDPANPTDPANPCGVKQGAQQIAAGAGQLVTDLGNAKVALESLLPAVAGDPVVHGTLTAIIGQIGDANTANTAIWGATRISAGANGIVTGLDAKLLPGLDQIAAGLAQTRSGLDALTAAVGDPATANTLRNGVARVVAGLSNPVCDLANPSDPANPCGVAEGLGSLGAGLDAALVGFNAGLGSTTVPGTTLLYGAGQLAGGTQLVAGGASRLQAEGTAAVAAGAAQVDAGAGQLAAGAGAAHAGAQQLAAGLVQLDEGGAKLVDGAGQASAGATSLADGLSQLDAGAGQLADGARAASDGGTRLAAGLLQLEDGAGRLAGGLGAAEAGSVQVADGMQLAKIGGDQLAAGAGRLTEEGTAVLAEKVDAASGSTALLLERVRAADARGQAEKLPYPTVEGADASAVYQFDIAGLGAASGLATGGMALVAVGLLGAAGGLMVVTRRRPMALAA